MAPQPIRRKAALTVACICSVALTALAVTLLLTGRRTNGIASQAATISEAVVAGRKVSYRTERIERVEVPDEVLIQTTLRDYDAVDLTFAISNESGCPIWMSSLRIAEIGPVEVFEDAPRVELLLRDELTLSSGARPSLHWAFVRGVGAQLSRNAELIPDVPDRLIPPRSDRSFRVRFQSLGSQRLVSQISQTLLIMDELDSLDRSFPELDGVNHVFVLIVELAGNDGSRARLYSDRMYVIRPEHDRLYLLSLHISEIPLPLAEAYACSPTEWTQKMLDWSIKTYRETRAYRFAKEHDLVPKGFEADAVSPYCYHQDPDTPLRRAGASRSGKTMLVFPRPLVGGPRVPRSNLPEVLGSLRRNHPALWPAVAAELRSIENGKETAPASKARFVLARLNDVEASRHPPKAPDPGTAAPQTSQPAQERERRLPSDR